MFKITKRHPDAGPVPAKISGNHIQPLAALGAEGHLLHRMRTSDSSRLLPLPSRAAARRLRLLPALLAGAALLGAGGCSSWNVETPPSARRVVAFFLPYKADIVQGNVVTTEQISQVKPGMTRLQVREILGTPLVTDPFHAQRWDYVFSMVRQGYEPIQRTFYVLFDGDAVEKVEATELPSENDFVASIARRALPETTPRLELTDAERAALPAPKVAAEAVAASAAAAAPTGPTRTYPPLESH
jgi:outer membrane protein assembly factor BamE